MGDAMAIEQEIRLIRSSGLFDDDWYRRTYGDVPNGIDPLEHYLRVGVRLGRKPSELFEAGQVNGSGHQTIHASFLDSVFSKWPAASAEGTSFGDGFIGAVEVNRGVVSGWVTQLNSRTPEEVEVRLGEKTVWRGAARRLLRVNVSGEQKVLACGFRVVLPADLLSATPQEAKVLLSNGEQLPGGSAQVTNLDRFEAGIDEVRLNNNGWVQVSGRCIDYAKPTKPLSVEIVDMTGAPVAQVMADQRITDRNQSELIWPYGGFATTIKVDDWCWPLRLKCVDLGVWCAGDIPQPEVSVPSKQLLVAGDGVAIDGRIEDITPTVVCGWARAIDRPDLQVFVDLFIDDRRIATTAARRHRGDLEHHFRDHGCHEYRFELTPGQAWQSPGQVEVRPRKGSGTIIQRCKDLYAGSKRSVIEATKPALASYAYTNPPVPPKSCKISFIALNLNGADLLERFFESFRQYAKALDFEILVVDHGSTDHSADVCEAWARQLDIKFLDRKQNYSFSASNNYAAARATGDYIVFINNDVRLCAENLDDLFGYLEIPEVGAVGVCLLDDVSSPELEDNDPPIQHLGVHFRLSPRGDAVGAYESRYTSDWRDSHDVPMSVPVVTGALVAVKASLFKKIGGFDEGYFYGWEDVDFCLKVRAEGLEVLSLNQIKALHLRAYSRAVMDKSYNAVRIKNRAHFDRRFGFSIRRKLAEERFSKPGYWTGRGVRVAFIVTENSAETMAGDYFTALELGEALSSEFDVECVFIEHNSEDLERNLVGVDVLIAMRDDFDPNRIKSFEPGMIRVAWVRNWFERFAQRPFLEDFDDIWASSELGAEVISEATGRNVDVVSIATNPIRFKKGEKDPALACDYCFTGSFWGLSREIIQNLDPAALPFVGKIFGQGWNQFPHLAPIAQGPLPYSRMADVYASTRLVIDDANHVTKHSGSVNSRVFDALAAGCLVVTNGVSGSEELFDGLLPTYDSPQELEALLFEYLGDEARRKEKVEELRSIVLDQHTYGHRAKKIWHRLSETSAKIRIAIKIGAPNREVLAEWGDYHFACSLRRALVSLGFQVRIDPISAWNNPASNGDDVVLVLRGLSAYKPQSHQINLMWMISHPDKISEAELLEYDHVFVASEPYTRRLEPVLGERVSPLLQCTDPKYFNTEVPIIDEASDLLFVGNSRNEYRRIIRDSIASGLEPDIYGSRWLGLVPDHLIKGENIDNRILASYYRSARVVLNDHWDTMREKGFISNRVFDVLACGGRLVSDPVEGMEELFGDAVARYDAPDDLRASVQSLQISSETDRDERDAIAAEIIRNHSFEARALNIKALLDKLVSQRLDSGTSSTVLA